MPLAGTASRAVFGAAVWLPCPSRGSGRSRLEKVPGLRRDRPPGVFVRWREPRLTPKIRKGEFLRPSRGSGRSRLEKVPGLHRDRPPGVFVRWREPPLTYENVRNGVPEALGGAAGDRHNRRK